MDRIPAIRRAVLADVPPLQALGWSVVAVAVPTVARGAFDVGMSGVPFTMYYPAVLLTALLLGWRWAVGVAVVSGTVANRLFLGDPGGFELGVEGLLPEAMFAFSCALLIASGEMCRRLVRELEAAKARETMLNEELLHRVKNMFATVNALATMTARHSPPDAYPQALAGRMRALLKATELLGVDQRAHCQLHRLVENALAPFRSGGNFVAEGPDCELPREACVPLSLALHELCTNAAKYGALSRPEGRVTLLWTIGEGADGLLRLSWREAGGPRCEKPTRVGMGTRLLRSQHGLGKVEVQFEPDGLRCEIEIAGVDSAAPTLEKAAEKPLEKAAA